MILQSPGDAPARERKVDKVHGAGYAYITFAMNSPFQSGMRLKPMVLCHKRSSLTIYPPYPRNKMTYFCCWSLGGVNIRTSVPQADQTIIAEKLSAQIVNVVHPDVLNSTAVRVTWEVRRNQKYIEGFHVKYRMLLEQEEQSGQSVHHSDFSVETIQTASTTSHVLHHLAKYTWYEIRVQPFHGTIEGQDSNTIRVRTFEDGKHCDNHRRSIKTIQDEAKITVVAILLKLFLIRW